MADDAKKIALNYMKAFEEKDEPKMASYLHSMGLYAGPLSSLQTADTFMKEQAKFMHITRGVRIKKVFADDTDVCVLWDYETIVPSIPVTPIAHWFKIDNGKIREMHLHFNAAPFIPAMEKGEIAQALAATRQK